MDKDKITCLIQGIEQNTNRIKNILSNVFDCKIDYTPDRYNCMYSKEEEKTYLIELTTGISNLNVELRDKFIRLKI